MPTNPDYEKSLLPLSQGRLIGICQCLHFVMVKITYPKNLFSNKCCYLKLEMIPFYIVTRARVFSSHGHMIAVIFRDIENNDNDENGCIVFHVP